MINFNRLRKDQILFLYNHRCEAHNRRYSEHPHCFERERYKLENCPIQSEKIGVLDIETTNLTATYGYVLSYAIKEVGKDNIKGRIPPPKKLAELLTKHFAEVEEIKKLGGDFTLDIDVRPNRASD